MPIDYVDSLKATRLSAVVSAIDAGGGAGKIKLYTAQGGTLLAVIPLAPPPCGTVSVPTLTFGSMPRTGTGEPGIGTQTATYAVITTSTDALVVEGLTVGTTNAFDIVLNSASISAGQAVTVTLATITHG